MTFDEAIGALGVFVLLVAFVLNAAGRLPHASWSYQGLNVLGAGLACYASMLIDFLPFIVLEGSWCAVALTALARACLRPDQQQAA